MIETDIQLSKLPFEMIVNVFVPRLLLVYRKGNLVSNIMDGNFWFDGDFFVRNLDASVELRYYQRDFFLILTSLSLFFFFSPFLPRAFSRF